MRWLSSGSFMIVDSSGQIAPETVHDHGRVSGGGLRGGSHGRVLGGLGWRGAGGVMAPGGGRARNSETVSTSRRGGGVLGGRRSWREEGGCGARAAEWMSDSRLRVTGA